MGSILRDTDGVTKFAMPKEGVVVITFDDRKTTASKIVKALEKGRFTVKGKPVFVKLVETPHHESSPGISAQPPQELPLYITSPDSSGTKSR